ncbi:MAG: response regulator transcription factor [Bdellovibrionales bacterium]
MAKILVLEDMEENFLVISHALGSCYDFAWAKTLEEGKELFAQKFDLALVDIALPDGDGFQFCYWIRSQKNQNQIPIIFVTASSSVESRIAGFSIGGDDYISRPFNPAELKARIDAKLRRSGEQSGAVVNFENISVDLKAQQVRILEGEHYSDVPLTSIEFKILSLMLAEPNRVWPREEILDKVWGKNVYVYPRSVDTHVSKLRKKLGMKSEIIESVHGLGYKVISASNASVTHLHGS